MASRLYRTNSVLQKTATLSHLENQVAAALALKSTSEFHFWLFSYVRYLVQEGTLGFCIRIKQSLDPFSAGLESKLRELCNDLLGPQRRSKGTPLWEPYLLVSMLCILLSLLCYAVF